MVCLIIVRRSRVGH